MMLAKSSVRSASAVRSTSSRRSSVVVRASGAEPPKAPTPPAERVFTDAQWDDAIKAAAKGAAPAAAPVAAASTSFGDVMAFGGAAPERANGRLAMLGFVAALGAELATGESVLTQVSEATGPILATFAVFMVATLVPLLKGANLKEAFGPLTPEAELLNGRAAMIGAAALVGIELVKGSALF